MNSKERVFRRLSGEDVDRVPNFSILMAFAANYANVPYSKFCLDYKYMVEANLKCAEDFGIDIVGVMSDAYGETNDYGANIEYPYDSLPICREHFIKDLSDIKKLKPFDPTQTRRMSNRLSALELYKKETNNQIPILGWVEGMIAEAADLCGLEDFIIYLMTEPEAAKEIMDICYETAEKAVIEQIKAGADIIGVGDAAGSVIGPTLYNDFIQPYEKKLFSVIKQHGAISRLHICGNITPLLDGIADARPDIVDVDHMVDFGVACERLKGISSVCGNIDPVSVLLNGKPQEIKNAVMDCLRESDEKSIIMPGCEVPKATPIENLKSINEALSR